MWVTFHPLEQQLHLCRGIINQFRDLNAGRLWGSPSAPAPLLSVESAPAEPVRHTPSAQPGYTPAHPGHTHRPGCWATATLSDGHPPGPAS